jgi:hypothetical protein
VVVRPVVIVLAIAASTRLTAQQIPPLAGGVTHSLGQPDLWKWTSGLALGWGGRQRNDDNNGTASFQIGVHNDLLNPVLGAGGLNFEAYGGARGTLFNSGLRARLVSPALRVGIGGDYNIVDKQVRLLLSVYSPVVRGGFFNNGSELRFDIIPGRSTQFAVAMETPIRRRIPAGVTRPAIDHVKMSAGRADPLPAPSHAALIAAPLSQARAAAEAIRRVNVPFLDDVSSDRKRDEAAVRARLRDLNVMLASADSSSAMEMNVRRFHDAVERAFEIALSPYVADSTGRAISAKQVTLKARTALLDDVLLPYNRLLGQVKRDDTTEELARRARGAFLRWLVTEAPLRPEAADAVAWVFSAVLQIVEDNRAALRRDWRDSRFVWLPLQYGLMPEDHDTQAELDALVERAVTERFVDGNVMSYVVNEQFQFQLSRTVHAARNYHVLWIHDFRGFDGGGNPDEVSYSHVLHSYLGAMTQRVREYDSTGHLPVYMILLDEWFYQVNRAQLWMNLLEDPTRHRVRLAPQHAAWERALAVAQDSLREAISHSRLLQAHRRQFGDDWLRGLVKVHVNITNTSDPSFWSWRVAKLIPLFDNLMRDHRKLVFYDVSEDDPFEGEALFSGAGVGEHYMSLSWEDRALLVRGPTLLSLKIAARSALLQQGMANDRIPLPLQPKRLAPSYDARIAQFHARERQSLRALTITNETGFDDKQINVAKAVLYTLMPSGSVIKVPDSLWNSAFWGSALLGCSLRGVRVLIIGPAEANAPAAVFGSMIRSQELFWRLLTAAKELRPAIERSGGLLRVGVFTTNVPVTDMPAKVRAVNEAFARHEWLRSLFGFPSSTYAGLATLGEEIKGTAIQQSGQAAYEADIRPKLHLKANFFASREAWELMKRPEWAELTRQFALQRMAQGGMRLDSLSNRGTYQPPILDIGTAVVTDWFAQLPPEVRNRVVFYTVMGSQNQNARSMVEDGEVAIVVSSWPSIIPYLDLLTLIGQSRWIDDPADLDALLPPHSGIRRRLAHWLRLAF